MYIYLSLNNIPRVLQRADVAPAISSPAVPVPSRVVLVHPRCPWASLPRPPCCPWTLNNIRARIVIHISRVQKFYSSRDDIITIVIRDNTIYNNYYYYDCYNGYCHLTHSSCCRTRNSYPWRCTLRTSRLVQNYPHPVLSTLARGVWVSPTGRLLWLLIPFHRCTDHGSMDPSPSSHTWWKPVVRSSGAWPSDHPI